MFNNSGLSLNQAPPIYVVLRFLLMGAFFGVVAGIEIFFFNDKILYANSSEAVMVVHTITIGVMASFMIGALFQMLPVLSGVFIESAELVAIRVGYTLLFGIIFLLAYFASGSGIALFFAIVFLSFALFGASFVIFKRLKTAKLMATSRGMILSIVSLFVLTSLGLILLLLRWGFSIDIDYQSLKFAHFSFALLGWIALLIVSVSFQVIEMFYVTSPFSKSYSKYISTAVFWLLWFSVIFATLGMEWQYSIFILIDLLFVFHFIQIVFKLTKRKRKVKDGTIWFWYLSSISFIVFSILLFLNIFISVDKFLFALCFTFFATGIAIAMSYKIVPFLVWFHLNAKGYFEAPMMHEIVHPKYIRATFWIFLLSFVNFSLVYISPYFLYIGSIFFICSFLMLFICIYNAINRYNYIIKNGKRVEFNF